MSTTISKILDVFNRQKRSSQLLPSDSLNGLRGIAALFVFFFHVLFAYTNIHDFGYGSNPQNVWLIQLPFLRIWYAGHAMVAVFFVVGGYVMSIKPLKLARSNQPVAFLEALVSSTFRRGLRLYIPAVVATFISMATLSAGLWEFSRLYLSDDKRYIYFDDHHIERASSLAMQLRDWIHETKYLTNVFNYYNAGQNMPYYPHYDPHLWTVPVEYRSSMLLALLLISLFRCRSRIRLFLMVIATIFCAIWDRWELVCFLSGAILCQIDVMTGKLGEQGSIYVKDAEVDSKTFDLEGRLPSSLLGARLPHDGPITSTFHRLILREALYHFLFFLGIFLLCCPSSNIESTPGYGFLKHCIPSTYTDPKRFPHTVGALLVVYCIMRSPSLRHPFNSSFAQYLGRISYSLYIVHGPLNHIIGYGVTATIWEQITGMETNWQWSLGLILGVCVLLPCVLICAELFWRFIELWSINMSRRLEAWCSDDNREGYLN